MPGIQLKKRLKENKDVTAKILTEIIDEVTKAIPTEDDYKVVRGQKKTVTATIPSGLRDKEFIVDEESDVLAIRIGKKMYKIADLTEIT